MRVLYLDVSATCHNGLRTGIERVARALAIALIENPPDGYRVEPVYLGKDDCAWNYFYARRYTVGMLGIASDFLGDNIVRPADGDIVLGLDISGDLLVHASEEGFFASLRANGVRVYFIVYDLLPLSLPHTFPPEADAGHARWLSAVAKMDGAICITQSVADDLYEWYSQDAARSEHAFHIVVSHLGADIESSAPTRGLPDSAYHILSECKVRPTFLMVGTIEPRKGYLFTLQAFERLWGAGADINLIIVGKEGWMGLPDAMRRTIPHTIHCLRTHHEWGGRLFWLEGISDEYLEKIYAASTCLIVASEGEGFGLPLIEAAQYGLPIIARDIPVFREVAGESAYYFQGTDPAGLECAIAEWLRLCRRNAHPLSRGIKWITWKESASNIVAGILNSPGRDVVEGRVDDSSIVMRKRVRVFVDISVTYRCDYKTGIQRVVRAILVALLNDQDDFFDMVPVCLDFDYGEGKCCYKKANIFVRAGELIADSDSLSAEMEFMRGDILLCLDLAGGYVVPAARQGLFSMIRGKGAAVYFVVYDLLPVMLPECFEKSDVAGYLEWLGITSESDGVLCISRSVAADYHRWFEMWPAILKSEKFKIASFYLGADINSSSPTRGFPDGWEEIINLMRGRPCFLSVGTLEPRKGYRQILSAFEILWKAGVDLILLMVGKEGWMMSDFCKKLISHPEYERRLIWLDGISDECLERIYDASTCLIAASEGEGFGLPLIEAARHKLPLIARDIPVFREVAGEHAHYFRGQTAENLACAVSDWLCMYKEGKHPVSNNMPWLTWGESAEQLKNILLDFKLDTMGADIFDTEKRLSPLSSYTQGG
jgi:glycosyltransferase involved in cell wall biosynthesis